MYIYLCIFMYIYISKPMRITLHDKFWLLVLAWNKTPSRGCRPGSSLRFFHDPRGGS